MKRTLPGLLGLLLLSTALTTRADQSGDFTYSSDGTSITITWYSGTNAAVTIPDTISGLPVTSIGSYAFSGRDGVSSVTIPTSVTSIGGWAFYFCTNLTNVTIPASVTSVGNAVFADCSTLGAITVDPTNAFYSSAGGVLFDKNQTTLIEYPEGRSEGYTIPDSVTNVENYAFFDCTRLADVTIPNGVVNLGVQAFSGCSNLTGVSIPDSVTSIGLATFSYCTGLTIVSIGHGVLDIGSSAFSHCSALTGVTIGASVTSIGAFAFSTCTNLTGVAIPGSVTSIDYNAFEYCSRLASIMIPDGVTSIGSEAFMNCSSLTNVTVDPLNAAYSSADGVLFDQSQNTLILCPGGKGGTYTVPNSVISIGPEAFRSCVNLASVTILDSVTSIGQQAFYYCPNLTSVTIGDGVTSIGSDAFNSCSLLTSLTMGTGVRTIGDWAFQYCVSLTRVTIPNNVTSIGLASFSYCTSLTNVAMGTRLANIADSAFAYCAVLPSMTIPGSVTNLGSYAFQSCNNLSGVYCQGNAPADSADTSVFTNDNSATVYYLPCTTGWTNPWGGRPTTIWVGSPDVPVTVIANPSQGGSATGSGTYPACTNAELSATAASGWKFTGWNDGSTNNPHAITVTPANTTYTADFACTQTLSTMSTSMAASASSGSVGMTTGAGCSWTTVSSTNWLHSTSTGTGNGMVDYTVDDNTNTSSRSGTLTIGGQTLTVTQAAVACSYTLGSTNAAFTASGGTNSVAVSANIPSCAWIAFSNNPFITITSGGSGVGNGLVRYSVAANTNTVTRTGTMTIAGHAFTVTQNPAPCSFTLGSSGATFGSSGGASNVAVAANGTNCAWSAISNKAFITITSGASGSGNGTVGYSVAANTNTVTRTGTIAIDGKTFTVTQNPAACSFALGSSGATFGSSGGSSNVAVRANGTNCAWSAISNKAFITVTSSASGSGNGTVGYSVAANTNTIARTGTIAIDGKTFTVTQNPAACSFALGSSGATFGSSGGSSNVAVRANGTNCAWSAISNKAFITITAGANGSGNGTLGYSVAANTNTIARTGTIAIDGKTFTVTQNPAACSFALGSSGATFGSSGGSSNVAVRANGTNCAWSAISNKAFITITSGASGSGNGTVGYSVAANTNTVTRTGTIAIDGKTFTVTQNPAPCSFALGSSGATFGSSGGSSNVAVRANGTNCAWSAISNKAFITITAGASGSGNGTVGYSVAANTNTIARTGTIAIDGKTFTVTQNPAACSFALGSSGTTFGAGGGTNSVAVSANGTNCAWSAISNNGFITVTAGASGSGNGTVGYSVAANTNTIARTGTIAIDGKTFTVTQNPAACSFALGSSGTTFGAGGGTNSVAVSANGTNCAWSAISNNGFITVTAGASGSGSGLIRYSVAANPNTVGRTGTIAIAGRTYTVTQNPAEDVRDYIAAAKLSYFDQINEAVPALSATGFAFYAQVTPRDSNSVTGAADHLPGGAVKTLTPSAAGNELSISGFFTTQPALDAAYSNGVYTLRIATALSGSFAPALNLSGDAYPNVPRILNYGTAKAVDAEADFRLSWTNFIGGTANDFISLEVEDAQEKLVFQTPALGLSNRLNGTATATVIPAGTLVDGARYTGRLLFVKVTVWDTTSIPNAVGITGYGAQTTFSLWTTAGGLWSGATALGNGWKWLDWFGYFHTNSDPWIYHAQHGWLIPYGTDTRSVFFWDGSKATWWWTSAGAYPYLYRFSDSSWLWYQKDSANPRWFYNLTAAKWESW